MARDSSRPTEVDAEVVGTSLEKAQNLPPDLVLLKMENETIMAMAAATPRNHGKILADIKAQLETYPSFAAEAIYSKPVGKDDSGKMKYADGLSIRAAESLREAYGFNRVGTSLEGVPGSQRDEYRLTATFVDYQKGMVWQDQEIVTPWYKARNGGMVRMPDDRFFNVSVKAKRSILVREVILRSIPAGLKSELFEIAGRLLNEKLDDAAVAKILVNFKEIGVTQEMIEKTLGKTSANWSKTDRKTLVGLWNAVKDGDTTVAEAFGGGGDDGKTAGGKPGTSVIPDSLAGATTTGQDGQSPGRSTAAAESAPGVQAAGSTDPVLARGGLISRAQKLKLIEIPNDSKATCLRCPTHEIAKICGVDNDGLVVLANLGADQIAKVNVLLDEYAATKGSGAKAAGDGGQLDLAGGGKA